VPIYQVRFFDARGRVRRTQPLDCHDDDQAIERFARISHRHTLELREGDRLVWRFDPPPPG
jgi:hypothetical protein